MKKPIKVSKTSEPQEFNYEEEVEQTQTHINVETASPVPQPVRVEFDYSEETEIGAGLNQSGPITSESTTMFLINGNVRLDRNGQASVTAQQTRLVYANDFNQAVAKFSTYFASMSNAHERYTVIGAAGSEAIR